MGSWYRFNFHLYYFTTTSYSFSLLLKKLWEQHRFLSAFLFGGFGVLGLPCRIKPGIKDSKTKGSCAKCLRAGVHNFCNYQVPAIIYFVSATRMQDPAECSNESENFVPAKKGKEKSCQTGGSSSSPPPAPPPKNVPFAKLVPSSLSATMTVESKMASPDILSYGFSVIVALGGVIGYVKAGWCYLCCCCFPKECFGSKLMSLEAITNV